MSLLQPLSGTCPLTPASPIRQLLNTSLAFRSPAWLPYGLGRFCSVPDFQAPSSEADPLYQLSVAAKQSPHGLESQCSLLICQSHCRSGIGRGRALPAWAGSLVQQQVGADMLGDHLKGCFTLISGAGLRRLRLGEWGWGRLELRASRCSLCKDFPASALKFRRLVFLSQIGAPKVCVSWAAASHIVPAVCPSIGLQLQRLAEFQGEGAGRPLGKPGHLVEEQV